MMSSEEPWRLCQKKSALDLGMFMHRHIIVPAAIMLNVRLGSRASFSALPEYVLQQHDTAVEQKTGVNEYTDIPLVLDPPSVFRDASAEAELFS